MPRYLTNLAGLAFRPAEAKDMVKALKPGDKLRIERDPYNPHDENAVRVLRPEDDTDLEGYFIGFVEKLANGPLARDLDHGMDATATVSNIYDDYENGVQKGQWAHPLIEIVTTEVPLTYDHIVAGFVEGDRTAAAIVAEDPTFYRHDEEQPAEEETGEAGDGDDD